jgi:cobalt-precorrin-5B (C1)-methyltransferase
VKKKEKPDPKNMREGFTTGACSAAAAKAAMRMCVRKTPLQEIEVTLPIGKKAIFTLEKKELHENYAVCSVIKDAGDDPDCTHGAELIAEVRPNQTGSIIVKGGTGVAKVTKGGLGLEIGTWAINPVPQKNIKEMVAEELMGAPHYSGAEVIISVPRGEEMAKETLNARLGLVGGISILGTTGIVRPYSTAAFRASVVQAFEMASNNNVKTVVLTTGGKSEKYAMELFPELSELSFIQVGDFIGTAIKKAKREKMDLAIIVGMMGKLSKMADGRMMTHAAGSKVNMDMLAGMAKDLMASNDIVETIRGANTGREVLEICEREGIGEMPNKICERVVEKCSNHAEQDLSINTYFVNFSGDLIGKFEMSPQLETLQ